MFDTNNIFNTLFVIPILNVLMVFYKTLLFVKIPGALGFSLVLLTVAIRIILHPLTVAQIKSTQKLTKLKPQLDKLQKLYQGDKQRIYQEQMQFYKEAGINPSAGCLPLLLQMPILIAIYNLFYQLLSNSNMVKVIEEINKVVYSPLLKIESLDLNFWGMNLADKPTDWQKLGWWLLAIPVVTALLQYWQTKLMVPASVGEKDKAIILKKEGEKNQEEDMSATMQKQMSIMMPAMIGFFAYSFPLGLSLYWNTFTVFGIMQQHYLNKQMEKENAKKN